MTLYRRPSVVGPDHFVILHKESDGRELAIGFTSFIGLAVSQTQFTAQPFDEGTSMRNCFVRRIWEKRDLAKRYVVSCT